MKRTSGAKAPFQLLPELSPGEFAALKADIAERGILIPVELDELGNVLDGHHRLRAWNELRSGGIRVPPYPRIVRRLPSEEAKLAHALRVNLSRRHLDQPARRQLVAGLRGRGWSLRRIAEQLNVDPMTVSRDLSGVAIATPEAIEGRDGKRYPAKVRRPSSILVNSDRQEERARAALAELGEQAPPRPMDLRRAESKAREARRSADGDPQHPDSTKGPGWTVECLDFRKLNVEPGTVDLILTDPPYDDKTIPLYSELGAFAARVLKPGRLLVCYVGNLRLPEEIERLSEHLQYVWTGVVVQPGRQSAIRSRMIKAGHRPVLIFSVGPYRPRGWILDTLVSSSVPVKDHHRWEQSLKPVSQLVEYCSRPGELVCDPFLGSGTTGVAAIRGGRRFVGCDSDPESAVSAFRRLQAETAGATQ
ncbi:MAG TPA: DNA methyltransferase [Acidimicrobiales bacterium]|nr:DNA methyltransferase [Acidimicrobiales bacterium]